MVSQRKTLKCQNPGIGISRWGLSNRWNWKLRHGNSSIHILMTFILKPLSSSFLPTQTSLQQGQRCGGRFSLLPPHFSSVFEFILAITWVTACSHQYADITTLKLCESHRLWLQFLSLYHILGVHWCILFQKLHTLIKVLNIRGNSKLIPGQKIVTRGNCLNYKSSSSVVNMVNSLVLQCY